MLFLNMWVVFLYHCYGLSFEIKDCETISGKPRDSLNTVEGFICRSDAYFNVYFVEKKTMMCDETYIGIYSDRSFKFRANFERQGALCLIRIHSDDVRISDPKHIRIRNKMSGSFLNIDCTYKDRFDFHFSIKSNDSSRFIDFDADLFAILCVKQESWNKLLKECRKEFLSDGKTRYYIEFDETVGLEQLFLVFIRNEGTISFAKFFKEDFANNILGSILEKMNEIFSGDLRDNIGLNLIKNENNEEGSVKDSRPKPVEIEEHVYINQELEVSFVPEPSKIKISNLVIESILEEQEECANLAAVNQNSEIDGSFDFLKEHLEIVIFNPEDQFGAFECREYELRLLRNYVFKLVFISLTVQSVFVFFGSFYN